MSTELMRFLVMGDMQIEPTAWSDPW